MGPPSCTTACQSGSGSPEAKAQSLKSGRGTSNPTTDRGAPVPSGPWHVVHAARYTSSPVRPGGSGPDTGLALCASGSAPASNWPMARYRTNRLMGRQHESRQCSCGGNDSSSDSSAGHLCGFRMLVVQSWFAAVRRIRI